MSSDSSLIGLRKAQSVVREKGTKASEVVRVRVHRVFREASLHTQVLNVIIQRTVKCDGHTTRYHNPIREPILCASATDLWAPSSLMRFWTHGNYRNGVDYAVLNLHLAWIFEP